MITITLRRLKDRIISSKNNKVINILKSIFVIEKAKFDLNYYLKLRDEFNEFE